MQNNKFKIAVIDSGIDSKHPRLKNARISGVYIKNVNGSFVIEKNEFNDTTGHGTACASIIHKIIPSLQLMAVKIISENQTADEQILYEAINFCLKDESIKVINISMGCATGKPYNKLFEICEKAYQKNIYIVAATHNDPTIECYPAYFSKVIGVCGGQTKNHLNYGILDNEKINIVAKGITQRVAWANRSFKITMGSSFAAAHFSGILADILLKNPDANRKKINTLIKENSKLDLKPLHFIRSRKIKNDFGLPSVATFDLEVNGKKIFTTNNKLEEIEKVAIFPASEKEMGSFMEFGNFTKAQIKIIIDYPRTLADKTNKNNEYEIKRRLPKDVELKEIDTLVIGYFYEHLFDANVEFGKKLIELGINHNKNFVVWSTPLSDYLKKVTANNKNYTGKIIIPSVNENDCNEILQYKYLPALTIPSILVIGTSNRQGKFTTQLRLMEILKKEGYCVELIATEPQGILFDSNHFFPYGHESTVEIEESLWVNYLVSLMKGIQKYKTPHIFLSGIQSNLIPRTKTINELGSKNVFSSLHYLAGFQPDGLICAINPQDSIEYIKQTIDTSKMYCNGEVLFFVMTPWFRNFNETAKGSSVRDYKFLSDEEMKEKMNEYSEELGYPVLNIMNKENDSLILEIIENTFAKENQFVENQTNK